MLILQPGIDFYGRPRTVDIAAIYHSKLIHIRSGVEVVDKYDPKYES